ncbi:DUF58 domain-containing protein [Paenibacillus bovis]|uniref:DUF58 domain-containing protein n=1 Tax=Paenibacillus bovis TaxID=1616788 RepID=A0A172ZEU0_9BACL|nr:DUF58 domain-containing protein [Paenibacillus bovis]ANF96156.1 hypothetical protein AR543_09195 [Paenibacillus bovis]
MELFWLMLVAAVMIVIQALVFGRPSLARVHYERKLSRNRCHAGEEVEMIEVLENGRALPLPWLRLEAMLPIAFQFAGTTDTVISEGTVYQNHNSLFSLGRHTRIVRRHHMVCRQRGSFRMESALMTTGDLFGLARASRPVQVRIQMMVYPAYVPVQYMPEAYHSWQGDIETRRWINEDPFLITGVREYRTGDPMNQVHWRATARTGQLQVFQHGYSADPEVMILLNIELSEQMWSIVTEPVVAEYAISCAATAAADLIGRGMKAGFGHNAIMPSEDEADARIWPAYGSEQLTVILQSMAELQLRVRRPFPQFLHSLLADEQKQKLDILIITPHYSAAMRTEVGKLEQAGSRVSILPVPGVEELKHVVS